MAKTVITITDLDINEGTVCTDISVTECATDDGNVTMAGFFAKFWEAHQNDPAFLGLVYAFAEDQIAAASDEDAAYNEAAVAA